MARIHAVPPRASSLQTIALCLALGGAGCSGKSYLEVKVNFPSPFDTEVAWLDVAAVDGAAADAGLRLPGRPVDGGLGRQFDGGVVLVIEAPANASVSVFVNGLDATGRVVASGQGSAILKAQNTQLNPEITLSTHCTSLRDCNADAVCQGLATCSNATIGFGACLTPLDGGPHTDGLACGACHGTCAGGGCQLTYCGCQDVPAGIDAGEQCDDGALNSDVLPDHCRTNCLLPHCGDGVLDPDAGEVCDADGGNGLGLGCNATCNLQGIVTTIAGSASAGMLDGFGLLARFAQPYGLAIAGNLLYVADSAYHVVRQIDLSTDDVQTVAGSGNINCLDLNGSPPDASFCEVSALLPFDGGLIVADDQALRFLAFSPAHDGGVLSTFAGTLTNIPSVYFDAGFFASDVGLAADYGHPNGIAQVGEVLYTNTKITGQVVASNLATGTVTVLATLPGTSVNQGALTALNGIIYTVDVSGAIVAIDPTQPVAGAVPLVLSQPLSLPDGLCNDGRSLYVTCTGSSLIQQIDPLTGQVSLVAGGGQITPVETDGTGTAAGFFKPQGCVYDPIGKVLYVSDFSGNTIRKIR